MTKTILLTGATDGIGLEAAKKLHGAGHRLLVHGRNATKLEGAAAEIGVGASDRFVADLSDLSHVDRLAAEVRDAVDRLDVLINNAGVFKTSTPLTSTGHDVRFVVNTLAPFRLTNALLPQMAPDGRIVNLSSAAQAPVDLDALRGDARLDDMGAYAQSKLALTMWSRHLADELGADGPVVVAVNPGSLLATKMVQDGFGVAGNDINIGADIMVRAATGADFADASGAYWDNDSGQFAPPHADALDPAKNAEVVEALAATVAALTST